ncbi:hypothetical protein [Caldisphaera sp.]|uniref:hypothetical protein n=1 Tax=Caldisphaera sp. TaxID=2060322 RepID=UPI003D11D631
MKSFIDSSLFIYLNVKVTNEIIDKIEKFFSHLNKNYYLYTNVLALDEVLYISKKKYKVEYKDTMEFIDKFIIPYVTILGLSQDEYELSNIC